VQKNLVDLPPFDLWAWTFDFPRPLSVLQSPPRLTLPDSSAYSPFRDHALFIFVGTRRVNGFAVALEINRFAVAPGLSRTGSGSWPGEILVNA
jgi:hypothetical protein